MTLSWRRHLSDEALIRIVDGERAAGEPARHLEGCTRCRGRLAEHRLVLGILERPWSDVFLPAAPRLASRLSWAVPALGLCLVIATGVALRGLTPPRAAAPTPLGSIGLATAPLATPEPTAIAVGPRTTFGPTTTFGPPVCPRATTKLGGATVAELGDSAEHAGALWSPEGEHVLLVAPDSVELLDRAGCRLAMYGGAQYATWIDETQFATASDWGRGGPPINGVTIHGLDGTTLLLPDTYDLTLMMGSGHGELALVPQSRDGDRGAETMVWKGSSSPDRIAGWPLAWSPDGTRLLVTETRPGYPASNAPLRLVAIEGDPGGVTVAAFDLPHFDPLAPPPLFSPVRGRIAFACGAITPTGECRPYVVTTATSEGRQVADWTPTSELSWLANGHLLLGRSPLPRGGLVEWDDSKIVKAALPDGEWAVQSPTGEVAVGTKPQGGPGTIRLFDARGSLIADIPASSGLLWSPDGSAAIVYDPVRPRLVRLR